MRASRLLLLCSTFGAAACASGTPGAGTVVLTSPVNYQSPPTTYSVGGGRVTGRNLDAALDGKGCVRGTIGGEPLDLCLVKTAPDGTQRWEGTSGEVSIKPIEAGKAFEVSGFMFLTAQGQFDVTQTLRAQEGGAWDELRAQPVLLLVATTATDLRALRRRRPL
jgi:hypothetical protein